MFLASSAAQLKEITVSRHCFDPTGSNMITIIPDRIEKKSIQLGQARDYNHPWSDRINLFLYLTQLDRKSGEGGNNSGEILEKAPTYSEARKTNFQHFRGKSSCERTERYIFNGLQIQLHKNDPIGDCNRVWPSWMKKVLTVICCNWAPGEAGNSSG